MLLNMLILKKADLNMLAHIYYTKHPRDSGDD